MLHPYGVLYMSNKSVGVFPVGFTQIHLRVILLVIPRGTMLQVDKHRSRVGWVVGVAMKSDMRCGGKLSLHLGIRKIHRVIARCGKLLCLYIMRAVLVPLSCAASCRRHDENVAKIHTSSSVQMVLCKAPYDRIAVDILGTIAPSHTASYRTGLYHSERSACSGECVSVVGIAYEWVDILGVVSLFVGSMHAGR